MCVLHLGQYVTISFGIFIIVTDSGLIVIVDHARQYLNLLFRRINIKSRNWEYYRLVFRIGIDAKMERKKWGKLCTRLRVGR